MKFSSAVLVGFWCLLPAFTIADESETQQHACMVSAPNSQDTSLRMLVREVGAKIHKHFVLDQRAPRTIDLGDLEHQDVTYPQLLSVLQVYGMVVVADGGILQVIPDTEARQSALPLVAPENIKTLDDEWVTCVLPVKNISAAQLVPLLRPMIPQAGHLAALPDRNALIIVDRSANVRRLVELARIIENLPKIADLPPLKTP